MDRKFMEKLEEKILKTIHRYQLIEKKDIIVIGVSGGPDSMTLLNVLYHLKESGNFEICVAHVNHMLRKEAEEETTYVQKFCEEKKIACYIKRVDVAKVAKEQKVSTELAGRTARYDFFEEVARKIGANKIATAHNANDNAETVLMNLMRGSGTSGLKGIEKIRDGKYIRPIIECTRKEIEEYVKEKNLEPKYDKSNEENIYTRNKIRNGLIPYIEKEFNPNIIETINRLSTIVSKEEAFLNKIVENEFEKLSIPVDHIEKIKQAEPKGKKSLNLSRIENEEGVKNIIILDLKQFNQLDDVIKSRLILYTISKLLGSSQGIEKIHIEDIIKLCGNNIGNKYLMPNKKIKIFIKKGKIFLITVI